MITTLCQALVARGSFKKDKKNPLDRGMTKPLTTISLLLRNYFRLHLLSLLGSAQDEELLVCVRLERGSDP